MHGQRKNRDRKGSDPCFSTVSFPYCLYCLVAAVASGAILGTVILRTVSGIAARSVLGGIRSAVALAVLAVLRIVLRIGVVRIVCVVCIICVVCIVCHNL